MIENKRIAVIIPAYNIGKKIIGVLSEMPEDIDQIFLIDDNCPLKTGEIVEQNFPKIKVTKNSSNMGVGGSVKRGYEMSLEQKFDISVKFDADGQMSSSEIIKLVKVLIYQDYEYVKGNRFLNNQKIEKYPFARFAGNIFLSFLSKLSSGYWDIFDPINGFTCIKNSTLKKIKLENLDDRYFFETDVLFNLYFIKARVKDYPVKIKYFEDQIQNMSIFKESFNFFFKNIVRIFKRINKFYFSSNFTIGSFFAFFSFLFSFFTLFFGGYNWIKYSFILNKLAPNGIVISSIVSLISSVLFIGIFFIIDSNNNPNKLN